MRLQHQTKVANLHPPREPERDRVKESEQMQSTFETLCELERQRFFGTLEIPAWIPAGKWRAATKSLN